MSTSVIHLLWIVKPQEVGIWLWSTWERPHYDSRPSISQPKPALAFVQFVCFSPQRTKQAGHVRTPPRRRGLLQPQEYAESICRHSADNSVTKDATERNMEQSAFHPPPPNFCIHIMHLYFYLINISYYFSPDSALLCQATSLIISLIHCFRYRPCVRMVQQPNWPLTASLLRFLDHTQKLTHTR